jgi:hypothetical protein
MSDEGQLDYKSPGVSTPGHGRSPATWVKLMAVWAVGLVSWTIYLIAILYLWIKWI